MAAGALSSATGSSRRQRAMLAVDPALRRTGKAANVRHESLISAKLAASRRL
jgi:hypothetical protein